MTDEETSKWYKACDTSWISFLKLMNAKKCRGPSCNFSNHGRSFAKDGQQFIFDNPYIPSHYLEQEGMLLAQGWRIKHLPLHMSWYVAGKCQPRLLAPPGSKADLEFFALLLDAGGYIGNFTLTHDFISGGHYCGGLEWQTSWSHLIKREVE